MEDQWFGVTDMSLLQVLASVLGDVTGIADVVSLPPTISLSSSSPSSFTIGDGGGRTGGTWESANNPTPVDTYHIKWEDHATFANPATVPFAKSTWTAIPVSSTWTHTESPPDISTRGFIIYISNDGGSTTLDSSSVSLTADETP